jgi:hypothetical protein
MRHLGPELGHRLERLEVIVGRLVLQVRPELLVVESEVIVAELV